MQARWPLLKKAVSCAEVCVCLHCFLSVQCQEFAVILSKIDSSIACFAMHVFGLVAVAKARRAAVQSHENQERIGTMIDWPECITNPTFPGKCPAEEHHNACYPGWCGLLG